MTGPADLAGVLLRAPSWLADGLSHPIDRFAHPWMAALALPALAAWLLSMRPSPAASYSDIGELAIDGASARTRLRWLPDALRAAGLAMLITAACRPQAITELTESTTEAVAIQLVIDRSSSMRDPIDAGRAGSASRLDAVKQVVDDFLARRAALGAEDGGGPARPPASGDLIGLIAFAGVADTLCPPVQNPEAVRRMLAEVRLARHRSEDDGTAIGEALELAAARLVQTEAMLAEPTGDAAGEGGPPLRIKSKVIVLLTDGYNTAGKRPAEVIDAVAARDIRVYTVGIVARSAWGRVGTDVDTLRMISDRTGGAFFAATDADTLGQIYDRIGELERTTVRITGTETFLELFPAWAAGGALAVLGELLLRLAWLRRAI